MLTSLFLRFIARNVDSIVHFIDKLDESFDAFLARHDVEVAGFEADIANIKSEAAKRIDGLEETIATKVRAAETVLGLKAALPTAKK